MNLELNPREIKIVKLYMKAVEDLELLELTIDAQLLMCGYTVQEMQDRKEQLKNLGENLFTLP